VLPDSESEGAARGCCTKMPEARNGCIRIHARAVSRRIRGLLSQSRLAATFVFVNWLMKPAGRARSVTVSYNEAARMMDGGARVDGVPCPPNGFPGSSTTSRSTTSPSQEEANPPPSFQGARRDDR